MTILEKVVREHEITNVDGLINFKCPNGFGYESPECDGYKNIKACVACWNREAPEKEESMKQTEGIKEEDKKVIVKVREPESCEGITFTYGDYYDASCIIQECLKAGKIVELEMRCE